MFWEVFDMLDYEVYWNSVVSWAWNDQISIWKSGQYEISESWFYESIVLMKYIDDSSSSLSNVPFESSAQTDII